MRSKKGRKNYSIIVIAIVILLVFLVVVPSLINLLFKLHPSVDFFSAEWSAGDALNYYGALIASIATIVGVYLSITYAQKSYKDDEKNRQRPYLALTHIKTDTKVSLFDSLSGSNEADADANSSHYLEYRLDHVYVLLGEKGITYQNKLNDKQRSIVMQGGLKWIRKDNTAKLAFHDYISLPFEIENVGNGAAIDLKLSMNRNDDKTKKAVSLYTLKCNDKIYFHIFSEVESDKVLGDYTLTFQYNDILGNTYLQDFPICFEKDNNMIIQKVVFSAVQKEDQ